MSDITRFLEEARRGDRGSVERLTEALYGELRRLARAEMRSERADHTLEPTALVHELYLRLVGGGGVPSFENRAHFFGAAATAIRRVLVEHARARGRQKRAGGAQRVELEEQLEARLPEIDERLLALESALEKLAELDPKKAKLVELRFFAGCSIEEAARVLCVSESTLAREWRLARAWLQAQLESASLEAEGGR